MEAGMPETGGMTGRFPRLPFHKGAKLRHNSIIGHFMVYKYQLETNLLQLLTHPEKSE